MKLLFDENLSFKLVHQLTSDFPGSKHVDDVDLGGCADERIWTYARTHGYVIVSKDSDFRERSFLHGQPPKVIWLDIGNSPTSRILQLLRSERGRIRQFARQEESLLVLSFGLGVL